jgi:MoxR-like ATPase
VQKEDLIDLMLICTTAQLSMLMLGTWGTGKSMLVRKLAEGLGISPRTLAIDDEEETLREMLEGRFSSEGRERRHFEYLVTRFTTPEELLGTANVHLMLNKAIFMRQTRGLLPRAEIAFLDEVFKANSSILNALLAIMNERVFHNAGRIWRVNLIALFGASNEAPRDAEEEDLGAFYDRFPVRALCNPVTNDKLKNMLAVAHRHATAAEFGSLDDPQDETCQVACVNDLRLLHKISLLDFGGDELSCETAESQEFLERFVGLFQNLRTRFDLSDRSLGQYYRLARARALIDGEHGRKHLVPDDCKVFYYCSKDIQAASELRSMVDHLLR